MIHGHADRIFDRSPVGMTHCNVHVYSESALPSALQSSDCRLNMYIPVYHTNGRYIRDTIGAIMNCLVGMGL